VTFLIDTTSFPVGRDIDYGSEDELKLLKALTDDAWAFVGSYRWSPPIADLVLAFGVAPIIGLFLMRFGPGAKPCDAERWLVVGDLPSMHFETDDAPTPTIALQLYCAIAQDWADTILEGRDLSESYPISVAPTPEHAELLKSRIETIRTNFIPLT
jgi:hypothetical protein